MRFCLLWRPLALALGFLLVTRCASQNNSITAAEPDIGVPLVAHWTFDEANPAAGIEAVSGASVLRIKAPDHVAGTRGVHGGALRLAGSHRLATRITGRLGGLTGITFSAWVRPTDLSGFREIFRQECPERLLFSFQHNGSILSLGLNIGGYFECDARLQPGQALNGTWHHCAATFDGQTMCVYFDGREIGSLRRPGRLTVPTAGLGFIGSSSGQAEHFQGGLDDLRIYAGALTPAQVELLHRDGLESVAAIAKTVEKQLNTFYSAGASFAATLASSRKTLVDKGIDLDPDLAAALVARLQSRFPEDFQNFVDWTGVSPADYAGAKGNDVQVAVAERMMGLLLEYRPLTESQVAKQSPAELEEWANADRIAAKYARLKSLGTAAAFSPEWIDVILEAGARINFRPVVSEAVAPYVTPATPPTRSLDAAAARAVLQRDWLYQADGQPSVERIKKEIQWAHALADRIETNFPGQIDFAPEHAALSELARRAESISAPDRWLYFRVREIKRAVLLKNPIIDFDKVLFVDMPFPQGSEWPHQTRHRLGYMAVPGGRLLVLDGLSPAGKLTQLMPQAPLHGSFWRPDLSYDARRVVFCFKPHNEKSFHLYEMNLDGSGLVQLTDGPFDDLDPIYLPDDRHIMFSTTRGHTYVRCMPPTNAFVLARCDRDGKNLYLVSYNNEPDYLPSVMHDGRVIYTRWEYTDKPLWRAQALWTVNPDGTQVSAFWGNQSVWPDLLKDARCIPGSHRVMFTGSAHHNWFSGSVGMIDPRRGFNFPSGLTKVTADVEWPESGNGPVDPVESADYHRSGEYSAYYSPYPLGEQDFLVSANRQGKFMLYLMDVDGNRELIYAGAHNILHALPVRGRPRPPVIPDRVAWPSHDERLDPQPGVIFSNNVYQGAPAALRGKAKFLRILNIDPKTYTYWHKRPYLSSGPVVSIVQSEGVKRVLGTVPIEADGSVAFHVPAGEAVHFQLLDGNYRALQTMRSFTGVMPGERRGCLGCHESHSRAVDYSERKSIALTAGPQEITPPPWNDTTVSYARYVQPVLDKYCGTCHQGDGEATGTFDLSPRPGFLFFDASYVTMTGRPTWGRPYEKPAHPKPGWGIANTIMVEAYGQRDPQAYRTPEPMTALSLRSQLIAIASDGKHYGVRVDAKSLRRLILWVDTMCPYRGEEEVRAIPDPLFQGVDWLAIRPKINSAPRIVRPGPFD